MKISKKIILLTTLSLISVFTYSCSNSKIEYKEITEAKNRQIETLDKWAQEALQSGTFDEKIEVLSEYSNLNEFKAEKAFQLSADLRALAEKEFEEGNLKNAYEMSKKIFKGMALQENIDLLAKVAKSYAQASFDDKKYPETIEVASKILELHWDEEAMDLKLAAEFQLLKIRVSQNNLSEAQKYYDDIMDITSLKGNENLAKKHRVETQKYSDKFPDSKFK